MAVLLAAVLAVASLVPLALVRAPPLLDYPDHLARCFVLAHLGRDPVLAGMYRDAMRAQPNLAMDALTIPLARVLPIFLAGRVFLGLTLLIQAGGCAALHRALHGRWSAWPALGFLFVYNRLFFWGFAGYLFAVGAALGATALRVAVRDRPWPVGLGVGMAAATGLYLLHLYGLGLYEVMAGGLLAAEGRRAGARLASLALEGVPAAVLFLFVSPTARAAGRFLFGGERAKLADQLRFLMGVAPHWDEAFLGLILLAAALLAWGGRLRIHRAAWLPAGVLVLLMAAMPDELFSSFGADRRIPIALALFLVAAADWHPVRAGAGLRRAVLLGAAVLILVRTAAIGAAWVRGQGEIEAALAGFARLPVGVRLLAAVPEAGERPGLPYLTHVDSYAVIVRDAFVPSLFAAPWDAGSPLGFTPRFAALARRTPEVLVSAPVLAALADPAEAARAGPFRADLRAAYGAAFVGYPALFPPAARLPAGCAAVARGADFVLFRLPCG